MIDKLRHHWPVTTRREFFNRAGSGLAGIALTHMLAEDGLLAAARREDPLAPKPAHHEPKAKAVIWLFMEVGRAMSTCSTRSRCSASSTASLSRTRSASLNRRPAGRVTTR